jgi:hypothetical protein
VLGDNTGDTIVDRLIAEMKDSMTVNIAYHANDPSVEMSLNRDIRHYKNFARFIWHSSYHRE